MVKRGCRAVDSEWRRRRHRPGLEHREGLEAAGSAETLQSTRPIVAFRRAPPCALPAGQRGLVVDNLRRKRRTADREAHARPSEVEANRIRWTGQRRK